MALWVVGGIGSARAAQEGGSPTTGAVTVMERAVAPEVLESRRRALLERLPEGLAVLRSAAPREGYPQASDFRQNNDFYYLTGLETPGSWLVLFSREESPDSVVLFVPARDPEEERWTGARLGAGPEVVRRTGIRAVVPSARFEGDFLDPLTGRGPLTAFRKLFVPFRERPPELRRVIDAALDSRRSVLDLGEPLAELRLVKDSVEMSRLRQAVEITTAAHRAAMRHAEPGMFEYEMEAIVEYIFACRGAERVGFPSIVGSGPNSVVLHYDTNRRRMREGDLVVIDIGAEYGYYTADITRTLPIGGRFSDRQRAVYDLVLATQQVAIDSVRPGMTWSALSRIARDYMREHSDGLCGEGPCDRYFLHGLGHWLGMDVHDVGSYYATFAPGMVLTIEPGIYLAEENLGVRIEDDVLVTEEGREVLSRAVPRSPEEIERLMAAQPERGLVCRD